MEIELQISIVSIHIENKINKYSSYIEDYYRIDDGKNEQFPFYIITKNSKSTWKATIKLKIFSDQHLICHSNSTILDQTHDEEESFQ